MSDEDSARRASATASGSDAHPETDPKPAEATYGWGRYDCARCGSATERAWRADEGFVCPDCVEW